MIFLLIVIILLILAEIFALLTVCRRGHSLWKLLRQYRYAHRGYHGRIWRRKTPFWPLRRPFVGASAASWTCI